MTYKVCYWDGETKSQKERDATTAEVAEIDARKVIHLPSVSDFEAALDGHLDDVAKNKRYNDRFACALRAGYPGPFRAEGVAFATWMDSCNAFAYQLLADVLSGAAPMPASVQSFIDMLPPMEWPA